MNTGRCIKISIVYACTLVLYEVVRIPIKSIAVIAFQSVQYPRYLNISKKFGTESLQCRSDTRILMCNKRVSGNDLSSIRTKCAFSNYDIRRREVERRYHTRAVSYCGIILKIGMIPCKP